MVFLSVLMRCMQKLFKPKNGMLDRNRRHWGPCSFFLYIFSILGSNSTFLLCRSFICYFFSISSHHNLVIPLLDSHLTKQCLFASCRQVHITPQSDANHVCNCFMSTSTLPVPWAASLKTMYYRVLLLHIFFLFFSFHKLPSFNDWSWFFYFLIVKNCTNHWIVSNCHWITRFSHNSASILNPHICFEPYVSWTKLIPMIQTVKCMIVATMTAQLNHWAK